MAGFLTTAFTENTAGERGGVADSSTVHRTPPPAAPLDRSPGFSRTGRSRQDVLSRQASHRLKPGLRECCPDYVRNVLQPDRVFPAGCPVPTGLPPAKAGTPGVLSGLCSQRYFSRTGRSRQDVLSRQASHRLKPGLRERCPDYVRNVTSAGSDIPGRMSCPDRPPTG
jgi:hypothetical protein